MTADADIVLNTASDSTRAHAWLPDADSHDYDVEWRADEGRLEWRSTRWAGCLRVTGDGTGASTAELSVEVDGEADVSGIRRTLDAALGALAVEVDQNFNVS